jgi:WD40 repeat protein
MSLAWFGGSYLAIGQSTGEILLWDWKTGLPFRKLLGHTGAVHSLAFYDSDYLISVSADTTIKIWNIYNGSIIQTIKDHSDTVLSVAILQNGFFVTGSNTGVILIHSFFAKQTFKTTKSPAIQDKSSYKKKALYTIRDESQINSLISLGNGLLASGSPDNLIRIWNVTAKSFIKSLKGHSDNIAALVLLENGDLISASSDKTILVWSLNSGMILKNISGHESSILSLALLENGQLAVGLANGKIIIRNSDLDTVASTLSAHTGPVTTLLEININNAQFLASASSKEAKVYVWNVETGSNKFISLKDNVRSLAQLKDGRLAIGTDKKVNIIDLKDPSNPDIELAGHSGAVLALAVLENGVLVSSSADKTVLLWKKKTNGRLENILTFSHQVSSLVALNTGDIQFALSDTGNKELVFYEIEFNQNDFVEEGRLDAKAELKKSFTDMKGYKTSTKSITNSAF